MRVTAVALALLVSPASCLLRMSLPVSTAVTPTQPSQPPSRAATTIRAALRTRGEKREIAQKARKALIGKVHRVARFARGGGGEQQQQEGGGILGYAASLPLLQALPPQVGYSSRCSAMP